MRTDKEIVARIKKMEGAIGDIFGFQRQDLISYLSFTAAKPWLVDEATEADWAEMQQPNTREDIIAAMRDYMPFALGKAENHRGLSAARSIDHFRAWLWLLGDDETFSFADEHSNFPNYGAPILKRICEQYSFPQPAEEWFRNMANGDSCRPNCNEGCGM